jgi:hypothetical protein
MMPGTTFKSSRAGDRAQPPYPSGSERQWHHTGVIDTQQFATRLLTLTVTPDRVAAVMARIAGERVEVGPLTFGPGGMITASGIGLIGTIGVLPRTGLPDGQLGFEATIPGDLTINLAAGSGDSVHSYQGTVQAPMHITVQLLEPARIFLAVDPLQAREVRVELRTEGMAAVLLQLGRADQVVADQVAKVVNQRVAAVADLRTIDLVELVDRSWDAHFDGPGADAAGG